VIECSGDHQAILDGLDIVARGGRMTIIGISAQPAPVFFTPVIRNEIQIHTTFNATWSNYEQALNLMARGLINMKALLSPGALGEAVKIFDAALKCESIKPVLIP
jgi:threonine dehydrogenase-like Zn-dependent dehydrogenase